MSIFSLEKIKSMFLRSKRGAMDVFQTLLAIVTSLAAVGIALTIAFLIIVQGQTQIISIQGINVTAPSNYTIAYNATQATQTALATFPEWLGIIVIALVGLVLLGIVGMYMRQRN